jgi:hypothetical protein
MPLLSGSIIFFPLFREKFAELKGTELYPAEKNEVAFG